MYAAILAMVFSGVPIRVIAVQSIPQAYPVIAVPVQAIVQPVLDPPKKKSKKQKKTKSWVREDRDVIDNTVDAVVLLSLLGLL